MSAARVDALGAMDDAADELDAARLHSKTLRKARAAVADLIEAAQCARSFIAVVRDGAGLASGETLAALNAALARIGGGAA